MTDLFIRIIEISVGASFLMLVVLLLRALLYKTPKWISCLLWGMVALRLIMPVSIESDFSLMPRVTRLSEMIADRNPAEEPKQTMTDLKMVQTTGNASEPNVMREDATQGSRSKKSGEYVEYVLNDSRAKTVAIGTEKLSFIAGCLWMAGMCGMLVYTLISWHGVRRRVKDGIRISNQIYECQEIRDAFILGVIRPRIYLPAGLLPRERECVLCHEKAHVARGDQAWKLLGFLLLTVYWFNPLVWISYRLFCRDVEMACDERATNKMKSGEKADYCQALLNLSLGEKVSYAGTLSFGARDARSRIQRVLNHKRPPLWVTAVALAASVTLCFCFMTSPRSKAEGLLPFSGNNEKQREIRSALDGITPSQSAIREEIIGLERAEDLLRDLPLYYVRDGMEIPVSITDLPKLLGRADDPDFRFWCFSVADLDGDDALEVILQGYGAKGDYGGRMILHQIGDRIYVYVAGWQSTWIIYENGKYYYSDWTTMEEGFAQITGFSKSDFAEEKYREAEKDKNTLIRACSYVFSEENLQYVRNAFQP